jgi:hypothetical protein
LGQASLAGESAERLGCRPDLPSMRRIRHGGAKGVGWKISGSQKGVGKLRDRESLCLGNGLLTKDADYLIEEYSVAKLLPSLNIIIARTMY